MYEGYLPTAHGPVDGPMEYILLPKLHQERCIVHFEDLHVTKAARTNSRAYMLSVDKAFDEVVEKCLAQHGESWLHPPIVEGFKSLFRSGGTQQVRMHSIEVSRDGKLVAGELGYSVGKTYCSLSGFTIEGGSGSVQCLGLALLLHERGFDFWDLGMGMEYKAKMGARDVTRIEFLRKLRASRDLPRNDLTLRGDSASQLLVPVFKKDSYVRVSKLHSVHGGEVGTIAGYRGAHFQVELLETEDSAKVSLVLGAEHLEDICAHSAPQPNEQKMEDGRIVVRGLAGFPMLIKRAPGWTRCRHRRKHSGDGADLKMGENGDGAASDASEDRGHGVRLRGGGHSGVNGLEHAAGACRTAVMDAGAEEEEEHWNRRKTHHVQWMVAAHRRRDMRTFLLQGR